MYSREWKEPGFELQRGHVRLRCVSSSRHQLLMKLSDMIPLSRDRIKMRMNSADSDSSTVNMIQTWREPTRVPYGNKRESWIRAIYARVSCLL